MIEKMQHRLVTCAYCGERVPDVNPTLLEPGEWECIGLRHAGRCEWIATRAHTIDECQEAQEGR